MHTALNFHCRPSLTDLARMQNNDNRIMAYPRFYGK